MKPYSNCPFCKKSLYAHSAIRQQCPSVYDDQEISFGIVPTIEDNCGSGFIQWQDGDNKILECISFYIIDFIIQIENLQYKTKSIHIFQRREKTPSPGPKIFQFNSDTVPFNILDPNLYKKIKLLIPFS